MPPPILIFAAEQLNRIENKLDTVIKELSLFRRETKMALADFQAALKAVDDETTRLGNKIQELLDKLAAGGLSPAEEQAVLDGIRAAAEKMKGIAADPANPVPEPTT